MLDFKGSFPQNGANMPRKYNENQIKEALELLDKWDGCIGKVSSAIGSPPSALRAWAVSKDITENSSVMSLKMAPH